MKEPSAAGRWRDVFYNIIQQPEFAEPLKAASLQSKLKLWTTHLTEAVVRSGAPFRWEMAAKAHPCSRIPESRHEYLTLDAMAFPPGDELWPFPLAVFELENQTDETRIAYSLWKVLMVRAPLRFVFCYRQDPRESASLVEALRESVIRPLSPKSREWLGGDTVVVVGCRGDAETFPYGFFKWWRLDLNTGAFRLLD